jgi:single-strand DNA-binding protein
MINQTIIQGRLCADPELRTTQSGVSVCSFRVAWSEKYKETETKLFLNCTAWRGTGEFVQKYFRKGQEIVVRGKLSTHEWDTDNGDKRSQIILTVDEASFCGPKRDETAPAPAVQEQPSYGSADYGKYAKSTPTYATSNAPPSGNPAQQYEQQSFNRSSPPGSFSGFSDVPPDDDDEELPF